MLSADDNRALQGIEQHLCAESPALDLWLRTGRGAPARPPAVCTVRACVVVILVAVGCFLTAWGLLVPSALPLVCDFYLVTFCFLGLWLPKRRRPRGRPWPL